MPTRFGRQPARAALLAANRSISATAVQLGLPRSHVRAALLGYSPPAPGLRSGLSRLLEVPVEALFTPDALAATYDPTRGPKAYQRRSEDWALPVPSTRLWDAAVAAAAADRLDPISDEMIIARVVALLASSSGAAPHSPLASGEVLRVRHGRAS